MATGIRQLILSILFLAMLPPEKIHAQEDLPPLDQTIAWLKAKATNSIIVNQQLSGKKTAKQQITGWSLDNPSRCILVWKGWRPEGEGGRREEKTVSVEINLADFDPQKINRASFNFSDGKRMETYWAVLLNTTDDKNLVNWHSSDGRFYSTYISFRFNDEDLADGVIRAFRHAINLCGGKSKPNEPDPFIKKKTTIGRPL
jgi:hypothetical protein